MLQTKPILWNHYQYHCIHCQLQMHHLLQGDEPSLSPPITKRGNPPKSKMMEVQDRITGLSFHFHSTRTQSTALFQGFSKAFMVAQ